MKILRFHICDPIFHFGFSVNWRSKPPFSINVPYLYRLLSAKSMVFPWFSHIFHVLASFSHSFPGKIHDFPIFSHVKSMVFPSFPRFFPRQTPIPSPSPSPVASIDIETPQCRCSWPLASKRSARSFSMLVWTSAGSVAWTLRRCVCFFRCVFGRFKNE